MLRDAQIECLCFPGVETLLCYLELHPQCFVELLHPTLSVCKVSCYDGPRQLQKITKMYEMFFQDTIKAVLFSFDLVCLILLIFLIPPTHTHTVALQLPWCWPEGG